MLPKSGAGLKMHLAGRLPIEYILWDVHAGDIPPATACNLIKVGQTRRFSIRCDSSAEARETLIGLRAEYGSPKIPCARKCSDSPNLSPGAFEMLN
jgi:hypothetical protein